MLLVVIIGCWGCYWLSLLVVGDVAGRWLVSDLGLIIGRGLLINNLVARQINNLLLVVTNLVAIEDSRVPHTLSVRVVRGWRYNCWKVTHLLVTILLVAMVINILVAMVSRNWWLLVRIVHWRPAYVHLTHLLRWRNIWRRNINWYIMWRRW